MKKISSTKVKFQQTLIMCIHLALFIPLLLGSCNKEADDLIPADTVSIVTATSTPPLNVVSLGAKAGETTDNTVYLQKALDSGQPVYIPKGTYLISKPLIKRSGSLIIKADQAVIKLLPSFPSGNGDATGAFLLSNLSTVNISGLTIDGNRAKLIHAGPDWTNYIMGIQLNKSSNIQLTNCRMINAPSISYKFQDCSQILVDHCSSANGMYHGILFNYCTNAIVQNCRIIGIGNQGTDTKKGGIGILGTGGNNLVFKNSYIENMSDTGTKTEGSNEVTWSADTVINSGKDGIKFQNLVGEGEVYAGHAEVKTVYHGVIENNRIDRIFNGRSDGSSQIQVWNASNVVISGNDIHGGTKTGQEDGINIWATVGTTADIVVKNNNIVNTNRFIYLGDVSNVKITHNTCINTKATQTLYNGFQADNSVNFTIDNNQFQKSGTTSTNGSTISIFDCADFSFTNNTVKNGYNGFTGRFKTSHRIQMSGNHFDNSGSYCASIIVGSPQTIDSLLINNNTISHVGMNGAVGWMFRINSSNLTCKYLDLSNTSIIGNGNNGDAGLTVDGGGNIAKVNLTNFFCNGNAGYPTKASLRNCINLIGWIGI